MKGFLYLLIVFLSIAGIALGILLYKEKINSKQYLSLYKEFLSKNDDPATKENYREFEIQLNGKDLSKNIEISDGKGNSVDLAHLFDQDKLILFFSDKHCDECVNAETEKLNQLSDYKHIVVLISATNKRYVSQYKSNRQLKYPVYEIKTNEETFSSMSSPFYFVIESKTMRINSTFVPQKHQPEETKRYLSKIIRDYF
jgi:hypothetical protein